MFRKPYRITVSRQLGGLGDLLMATPVFRGLREKYGKHTHITVMTTWAYGAGALPLLLKGNPFVDEVIRVEPEQFAPSALRNNKKGYENVPNDWVPVCVQNCDLFVELNVICAMVETRTQPNVTQHRTDIWCDAARVNPSSRRPILNLTRDELTWGRAWADHHLGNGVRVGVVLNTMSSARSWPHADHFAVDCMEMGYKVLTIDSCKRVHDQIPALIGRNIREVAAVVAHLDAVVTPDTGLLHLAGTMGTPVLGLFGSTDGDVRMREYAGSYTIPSRLVKCGPCWYNNSCLREKDKSKHFECMQRISRKLVMHELQVMLEKYGQCQQLSGSKTLTALP
jgi:ADP-heptose:LPS heptosyltransferase